MKGTANLLNAVFLTVLLAAASAAAQPVDAALKAELARLAPAVWEDIQEPNDILKLYGSKQYDEAFKRAEVLALVGNSHAMYWLGRMYLEGNGVEQDLVAARRWLQLSDAKGLGQASRLLGRVYAAGNGVQQDLQKARALEIRGLLALSAFASVEAKKFTPGFFGHKWGDELPFRYFTQWGRFQERLAACIAEAPELSVESQTRASVNRLPEGCRPKAPPARVMTQLKVFEVTGNISVFLDSNQKADGIMVHDVIDMRLIPYVFEVFDKAFRNEDCQLPRVPFNKHITIPFTFKLD